MAELHEENTQHLPKPKRVFKTKADKFVNERSVLFNKLMHILGLDVSNSFSMTELDNNIQKQQEIVALKDDAKKYFCISGCTFNRNDVTMTRDYMSIFRNICKSYGVAYNSCIIYNSSTKKQEVIYTIISKTQSMHITNNESV